MRAKVDSFLQETAEELRKAKHAPNKGMREWHLRKAQAAHDLAKQEMTERKRILAEVQRANDTLRERSAHLPLVDREALSTHVTDALMQYAGGDLQGALRHAHMVLSWLEQNDAT
jgi:hypothetical protein